MAYAGLAAAAQQRTEEHQRALEHADSVGGCHGLRHDVLHPQRLAAAWPIRTIAAAAAAIDCIVSGAVPRLSKLCIGQPDLSVKHLLHISKSMQASVFKSGSSQEARWRIYSFQQHSAVVFPCQGPHLARLRQ
eukprot:361411-Chlamydomonas_euryale.AAC.2